MLCGCCCLQLVFDFLCRQVSVSGGPQPLPPIEFFVGNTSVASSEAGLVRGLRLGTTTLAAQVKVQEREKGAQAPTQALADEEAEYQGPLLQPLQRMNYVSQAQGGDSNVGSQPLVL